MNTITLPVDLAEALSEEARKRDTTAEQLAVETLRMHFPSKAVTEGEGSLYDLLADSIGVIQGSTEPLSQNCSERFTDMLVEEHLRKRP